MKKRLIAKILVFSLLMNSFLPVFAEDTTPKEYEDDEFPQTLKDLRRFEIITLGSLPFITLDATLAYSTYRYAANNFDDKYRPDIFSSSSFTQEEQTGIILTSIGICVGIGLTDLIVQIVKRNSKKKKKQINYDDIAVIPISEDEDASVIPLPQEYDNTVPETSEDTTTTEEVQEIEE